MRDKYLHIIKYGIHNSRKTYYMAEDTKKDLEKRLRLYQNLFRIKPIEYFKILPKDFNPGNLANKWVLYIAYSHNFYKPIIYSE